MGSIGFDPNSIACDPNNDIPGWERGPPCLLKLKVFARQRAAFTSL